MASRIIDLLNNIFTSIATFADSLGCVMLSFRSVYQFLSELLKIVFVVSLGMTTVYAHSASKTILVLGIASQPNMAWREEKVGSA
jgi:hypothetical protein